MVKREQFSINGKMVLITGASGGLGEQLAYECAKQQAGLILVARREEVLKQVANNCQQWTNQPVYYYACDLSKATEVELLLEKIQSIDVDIVINNAGRGYLKQAVDLSKEEIEEMLQLNLYTLIQTTQHYLPKFIKKKSGMFVQIASQAGKTATPKTSVYSASKFGVLGYSNALRLELKEQGIHVMTVNPGPIATQFFEKAEPTGKYLASVSQYVLTSEEVAREIVRGMELQKREVNVPYSMNLAAKLNFCFPKIGDFSILKLFNKK